MEKIFNLQLFVEDESTETESGTDNGTEQQEQAQEIPAELAGVDEETAHEIMQQAVPKTEAQEESHTEQTESSTTEADSDKKTVDEVLDEPNQAIPYKRFKEVNDKAKAAAQEAAQLKEQLAALQAQPRVQPIQQVPAEQQIPQRPQINAEFASRVNQIAFQEALKMSGLTKEETDVLEYADDNDPKAQMWKGALELAKTRTWNAVDTEFKNRQQQAQQTMQVHQTILKDYSSFEQEQMQAADFEKVKEHAVNDMFLKLPPLEQQTIAAAWQRVEKRVCSPQDVLVVKEYFSKAAADYRKSEAAQKDVPQDVLKQKTEKLKQMEKHPKVEQISGSVGSGPALTVDGLERMLQEKDWDDIPADIQKMLLNGGK